jgi:hypothetical protein
MKYYLILNKKKETPYSKEYGVIFYISVSIRNNYVLLLA